MKRKTFFILLIGLLEILLTASVYAHSGRTDANGGHYDNETGEYHYHHGYPAHKHVNGICPYDYDDQTDHSSGTSSSSTVTHKPELHIETPDPLSPPLALMQNEPTPSATPAQKNTAKINSIQANGEIAPFIVIIAIACVILTLIIHKESIKKSKKQCAEEIETLKHEHKKEVDRLLAELEKERRKPRILDEYGFDKDYLPYKFNSVYGWGREFNVFVTQNGHCYHKNYCKALKGKGKTKTLLHRYIALKKGYDACHYCTPQDRVDDWYIELFPNSLFSNLNKEASERK